VLDAAALASVGGSVLLTRCWIGGSVFRYANMAFKSSSVIFAKKTTGIPGLSAGAPARPVRIAVTNTPSS